MDLSTSRGQKILKHQYLGKRAYCGQLLYKPLLICHFEITASQLHAGKEMLAAQVYYVEDGAIEARLLIAEGYKLLKTIRGTEAELPHYTKIIRKRDGYYYFAALNDKEKEPLKVIEYELQTRRSQQPPAGSADGSHARR